MLTYYDERNIFNEMSVDRESERRPPIIIRMSKFNFYFGVV